jgi:hypothetical protein
MMTAATNAVGYGEEAMRSLLALRILAAAHTHIRDERNKHLKAGKFMMVFQIKQCLQNTGTLYSFYPSLALHQQFLIKTDTVIICRGLCIGSKTIFTPCPPLKITLSPLQRHAKILTRAPFLDLFLPFLHLFYSLNFNFPFIFCLLSFFFQFFSLSSSLF